MPRSWLIASDFGGSKVGDLGRRLELADVNELLLAAPTAHEPLHCRHRRSHSTRPCQRTPICESGNAMHANKRA
eukprot:2092020-Rhodomonas_salina.1